MLRRFKFAQLKLLCRRIHHGLSRCVNRYTCCIGDANHTLKISGYAGRVYNHLWTCNRQQLTARCLQGFIVTRGNSAGKIHEFPGPPEIASDGRVGITIDHLEINV